MNSLILRFDPPTKDGLTQCCCVICRRPTTTHFVQRALCYASTGLAFVSMLKAVEKAREGSPAWMERGITSANAGLTAVWVAQVDGQDQKSSVLPSQIAALSLSLYQMLSWWTSRQGGEHVDFPVAVILFVVAVAAIASMRSTLNAADSAFRASGVLAEKVSTRRNNKG